jgi:hypothetical protein
VRSDLKYYLVRYDALRKYTGTDLRRAAEYCRARVEALRLKARSQM